MERPNSIAFKSTQQTRTSENLEAIPLDFPPLHLAVQSGNFPEVEQLVTQGVDLDVPANLPFPELVQRVFNKLTFGTLPHAFPALFYAIYLGRRDIAKLLISKGASLNLSPASRNTKDATEPLRKKPRAFVGGHTAAAGGHTDNDQLSRTGITKGLRRSKRIGKLVAAPHNDDHPLLLEDFSTALYRRPGRSAPFQGSTHRLEDQEDHPSSNTQTVPNSPRDQTSADGGN
jgi:hypothetical protein